ncbi:hypothetical protein [Amycolatopsis silviterrae]|uniref:Uncharacterized protein n=1 Tax=Amycolatopsis silviterrae TaxID=1656914 RepID=A0ABW5HJ70_9PSEU
MIIAIPLPDRDELSDRTGIAAAARRATGGPDLSKICPGPR